MSVATPTFNFDICDAPARGSLSNDAADVCASGRRAACAAGQLDGAYWLIGRLGPPGSRLPLRASVARLGGAYRGGRPPTACFTLFFTFIFHFILFFINK